MGTLHTFRPRQIAPVPVPPSPPSPAETRRMIEEAAQAALDTADSLLAILDRMDGDTDAENSGDAESAFAALENHHGSQVAWLPRIDRDQEAEAPETLLPVVRISAVPRFWPDDLASVRLAWGGHGNVIAAAGVALLNMVGGR